LRRAGPRYGGLQQEDHKMCHLDGIVRFAVV
jgi:hypothetical protein